MVPFRQPESALRAIQRLQDLATFQFDPWIEARLVDNPDPDRALHNLERWLHSTGNPVLHLGELGRSPSLAHWFMVLMGASQPISDALIQNPELSSLILDPQTLPNRPTREQIVQEGLAYLAASHSYRHSLDRLRYLRQRWMLAIVMNDLAGTWSPPQVWRALSDLADAVVELVRDVVWAEVSSKAKIDRSCPVSLVAFGKMGGHELNYSSDIDLVYVVEDGLDSAEIDLCTRYGEMLTKAVSDRMGRGSLYRVDLRLRPYGAAGPLVPSWASISAYYELYAEPWEWQALIRSRMIAGTPEALEWWKEFSCRHAFRPTLSELSVQQMLEMRQRTEDSADERDLKRGRGGIRDVEFAVQSLQMLHGHRLPSLRIGNTLEALDALESENLMEHSVATALRNGYIFLRQLEHRIQLVGDQQTHTVPVDADSVARLSRLMNLKDARELEAQLQRHRQSIGGIFDRMFRASVGHDDVRNKVLHRASDQSVGLAQWMDAMPESDAFYGSLFQNESSQERMERVLRFAPALVNEFRDSVALTEALMSGEIEEDAGEFSRLDSLAIDAPLKVVAETYRHAKTRVLARWSLDPKLPLEAPLTALLDALITHCSRRLYLSFSILGLGSYANGQMGPDSDGDLFFLIDSGGRQAEAEMQAQSMLALLGQLKRYGANVPIDMRLRPEGGKGLLVRTYDGLRSYELSGMELWERFMLGQARLITGSSEARDLVSHVAYALPLTPERLRELLAMKTRIENERVSVQHRRRNVKLGLGGLNDVEWFVHLHEMRFPTATKAGANPDMGVRIRTLGQARLINAVEVEELLEARRHLLDVRARLSLMGIAHDTVPENPDKLHRLATAFGLSDGNAFLARHERVIEVVRQLYTEGLERLRA
jgi:glutamate-ammonia-ligase adenylyltransferase